MMKASDFLLYLIGLIGICMVGYAFVADLSDHRAKDAIIETEQS